MISYEEIKIWLDEKENKQKIVYGICFVLVFVVGFGTGKFYGQNQKSYLKSQINYTTKQPVNQTTVKTAIGESPAVKGTSTPVSCPVKGNINAKGAKIYHVIGGMYYKIVKPEQCFATEGEALAAGFVKSSR